MSVKNVASHPPVTCGINYEYKKDKTNPFFFPQNTDDLPFPFMGLPPLTLATIAVSAF